VIEVVVLGLGRAPGGAGVLLLLKERAGPRLLPLGIGPFEAEAIALWLQGVRASRPLSHDLLARVLVGLQAHLERVEVSALTEGTFHAQLVVEQAGQQQEIDSRPSDAVALALRTAAPIYVAGPVLDEAGVVVEQSAESGGAAEPADDATTPADASRLGIFREFIETLDTDDLGADDPGSRA
jgi:uncharacterized protein